MKPIPKSSRESNRYIACVITAADNVPFDEFSQALDKTALEMVGRLGIGQLGLQVVRDQYHFPQLIIKTNVGQEQVVRAIICAITTIGNQAVKVESVKTSGTINHVAIVKNKRKRSKPINKSS